MELAPQLIPVNRPRDPEGVVLVLHGGGSRAGSVAVSPTQLSVLRMVPVARRIARAGHGRLAVFRLLNARRGWETGHTPVEDAAWALEQIAEQLGQRLPVCLVGHSLGGRAAILSAGRPEVRGVAALAPWVYPGDVPAGMEGTRVLIVHGDADRVASLARSQELARRLERCTPVEFRIVPGGKHAMLRHASAFVRPAANFARDTLLGEHPAREPRGGRSITPVQLMDRS